MHTAARAALRPEPGCAGLQGQPPPSVAPQPALKWPGQVTIAGCQTYWTMEVAEALGAGNLSNQLFPQLAQRRL